MTPEPVPKAKDASPGLALCSPIDGSSGSQCACLDFECRPVILMLRTETVRLFLSPLIDVTRARSYPRNCDDTITAVDQTSSHVLKDHCLACSKRHRSIVSNTSDAKLVSWFQGLRKSNLAEYRKVMRDHASSIPATGRGVRAKFDLLEYFGICFLLCFALPLDG